MPSPEAVIWLSNPQTIDDEIQKMLSGVPQTVSYAKKWFERINLHPPKGASLRIWNVITEILK